jgi:hypothetical protein
VWCGVWGAWEYGLWPWPWLWCVWGLCGLWGVPVICTIWGITEGERDIEGDLNIDEGERDITEGERVVGIDRGELEEMDDIDILERRLGARLKVGVLCIEPGSRWVLCICVFVCVCMKVEYSSPIPIPPIPPIPPTPTDAEREGAVDERGA